MVLKRVFGGVLLTLALLGAATGCSGGSEGEPDDAGAETTTDEGAGLDASLDADETAAGEPTDGDDGADSSPAPAATSTVEPVPTPRDAFDVDRPEVPDGSGAEATGPLGSTDLELETDEGSVAIGDAEVPELARDFPVPDGLEVQLASETATDAGFSGTAPGLVSNVAAFYRSALGEAGFSITQDTQVPSAEDLPSGVQPTVVLVQFESPTKQGDIAITPAPGSAELVSVIVAIAER